jgi:hypothetical protein
MPSTEYAPETEYLVDLDKLDAGVSKLKALVNKRNEPVWVLQVLLDAKWRGGTA